MDGTIYREEVENKIVTIASPGDSIVSEFNVQQLTLYIPDSPNTDSKSGVTETVHSILLEFISDDSKKHPKYKVFLTEVIKLGDRREDLFGPEEGEEIEGLLKRETWKVILRSEIPDNAIIFGGRFVLVIKRRKHKQGTIRSSVCRAKPQRQAQDIPCS